MIVGFVENEGALMAQEFFEDLDKMSEVDETFDVTGPMLLLGADEQSVSDEDSSTANLYRLEYLSDSTEGIFNRNNVNAVASMFSDVRYIGPVNSLVEVLSQTSSKPTYYYNYRHRSVRSFADIFGAETTSAPGERVDLGVAHGDDIFSLFTQKGYGLAPSDAPMAKKMINLWTSFAKSGNPGQKWEPVGKGDVRFAVLDTEPLRMEASEEFAKRMSFFNSMTALVESYRAFDIHSHPAIQEMLKIKESEDDFFDSHDEL